MELIETLDQALANVEILEAVRTGRNPKDAEAYRSLIKRGTCFLPYPTLNGLAFAPSRFIGYVGNNFDKHPTNKGRDGRQTNSALNAILGHRPVADSLLEEKYRDFCATLGFAAAAAGSFGVARKYWIPPEIHDRLDMLAEEEVIRSPELSQTEKEQIIKARKGQGAFRDGLFAMWKGRCCLTRCDVEQVLRASHIKPWRISSNKERLDAANGLLLTANLDALFDRGLISFSDDGEILRAPEISARTLELLGCDPTAKVRLTDRHAPYLDHHRREIFRS